MTEEESVGKYGAVVPTIGSVSAGEELEMNKRVKREVENLGLGVRRRRCTVLRHRYRNSGRAPEARGRMSARPRRLGHGRNKATVSLCRTMHYAGQARV
ncbi:hypothetical protein GOBAR_AA17375 [Gossypium barbadense]|uniref:Uncharacterized protein n=1 Tax=Gossypium barbadense TaxID=3634 RepID=A0A2P5XIX0_GOSBA|nr:hypothetical protein GOBAR_AA17375 [Gossypium barbadense]